MTLVHQADARNQVGRIILAVIIVWAGAVLVGAQTGFFAALYPPVIGAIVAATIVAPTLLYFGLPGFRAFMDPVGHRRILLLHTWRVPAALAFFWYGSQDALPPVFWILAGTGDLIAGSYAAWLLTRPESARATLRFHVFGFADFVIAVGTGLTLTLLLDPRMAPIAVLPLALIPLFGVGISGATHLMAFDMLRRSAGFAAGRHA